MGLAQSRRPIASSRKVGRSNHTFGVALLPSGVGADLIIPFSRSIVRSRLSFSRFAKFVWRWASMNSGEGSDGPEGIGLGMYGVDVLVMFQILCRPTPPCNGRPLKPPIRGKRAGHCREAISWACVTGTGPLLPPVRRSRVAGATRHRVF